MKSILQTNKECYVTGSTYNLHKHHIYAGGRRQISEREGFWVYLRGDLHNQSDFGVHGKHGHELDMTLKRVCQRVYEESHSREEFMALIGKNYLD